MLWIDQPVGTGFSYSEHPVEDTPQNEAQVAEDLYQFLQVFFQQNPQYNKQFYVFGESYAGHYIPALGARIVNGNKAPGKGVKIALAGLGIGNGWVDPVRTPPACSPSSLTPLPRLCSTASTPTCCTRRACSTPCRRPPTTTSPTRPASCSSSTAAGLLPSRSARLPWRPCSLTRSCRTGAPSTYGPVLSSPCSDILFQVYNVRERCEVEPLCYNFSIADSYLAQPSVRKALGVNPKVQWVDCAQGPHFALLDDWIGNFAVDVPTVLTAGIPVLVYSGTDDFVCNYLGGEAWVSQMSWPGQKTYNAAPWANWYDAPHQTQIGRAKTAQGLTFLEVFNAGRTPSLSPSSPLLICSDMVPMDQPVNSLQMLATFLAGRPFGKN